MAGAYWTPRLKPEIFSMPKSKGISSPLLFSFCTLSRYLCHSFQHCQLVFRTVLYSFCHIGSLAMSFYPRMKMVGAGKSQTATISSISKRFVTIGTGIRLRSNTLPKELVVGTTFYRAYLVQHRRVQRKNGDVPQCGKSPFSLMLCSGRSLHGSTRRRT